LALCKPPPNRAITATKAPMSRIESRMIWHSLVSVVKHERAMLDSEMSRRHSFCEQRHKKVNAQDWGHCDVVGTE
jgi:hypothetical protein